MSIPPTKDIPPARRQPTEISLAEIENLQLTPSQPKRGRWILVGLLLIAGIGGASYWQWDWLKPRLVQIKSAIAQVADRTGTIPDRTTNSDTENSSTEEAASLAASSRDPANEAASSEQSDGQSTGQSTDSGTAQDRASGTSSNPFAQGDPSGEAVPDELLNHRRYEVASPETLVALNPSSSIKLQPDAQAAIAQMIARAKAEGVQLGIISGFRTLEDQDYLYFDLKAERGESAQTRAEVSAPPGYSEHHTGYAVDFIDESRPDTRLEESFETTLAFQWLERNAAFFNFEMSFPKDNEAQVRYEPWHWRYVGNQESLELFYR